MSESDKPFGERLRALRVERGLSQSALAERARMSTNAVGSLERGVRSPRVATAEALAKALDVPLHMLLEAPLEFSAPEPPPYTATQNERLRRELDLMLADQPERVVRLVVDVARRVLVELSAAT